MNLLVSTFKRFYDAVNLVQHYAYSAFGKILSIEDQNGTDVIANPVVKTSYTYTNREYDEESGMYYYRARYYEPSIGRFLSEDAHQGDMKAPRTKINKYIYGLNNPSKYVDPSGNFVFTAMIIGAAIGGLMAHSSGGNVLEGMIIGAIVGAIGAYGGQIGAYIGAQAPSGVLFSTEIMGSLVGTWLGASFGAAVGGIIGGNLAVMRGGSYREGDIMGTNIGGAVGGITGGLYGYAPDVWGADQFISEYIDETYVLFKHAGTDPISLVLKRPWVVTGTVLFLANEFICGKDERYSAGQGCVN